MRTRSFLSLLLSVILTAAFFTGCHGSKGLPEFHVPEEFDTA